MFRMLKLNPPNGWRAVAWELAIVTLGVLIALAVQQWTEQRSWRSKARAATAAFRYELGDHYIWAVEWRVVEPCIVAQIDQLQRRLLASGATLDPAPVHNDPALVNSRNSFTNYVMRIPSKDFDTSAWQSSISDGVSSHLDPQLRQELDAHYVEVRSMINLTARNDIDYQRLLSLSRPLPLDPMVRFSLLQTLDELRGRTGFMALQSGQMIDHIVDVGMVPSPAEIRAAVTRFGTYQFCRTQRLPLRSLAAAMRVSNN